DFFAWTVLVQHALHATHLTLCAAESVAHTLDLCRIVAWLKRCTCGRLADAWHGSVYTQEGYKGKGAPPEGVHRDCDNQSGERSAQGGVGQITSEPCAK